MLDILCSVSPKPPTIQGHQKEKKRKKAHVKVQILVNLALHFSGRAGWWKLKFLTGEEQKNYNATYNNNNNDDKNNTYYYCYNNNYYYKNKLTHTYINIKKNTNENTAPITVDFSFNHFVNVNTG